MSRGDCWRLGGIGERLQALHVDVFLPVSHADGEEPWCTLYYRVWPIPEQGEWRHVAVAMDQDAVSSTQCGRGGFWCTEVRYGVVVGL